MSDLRDLYQEVIIDHGRHPRNFGEFPEANHHKEGFNPLCGDKITLHVSEKDNVIEKVMFQGSGCAISIASASLMTEFLRGRTIVEAEDFFQVFHEVVMHVDSPASLKEKLGKLSILSGVAEFPARVKCATLAWHTLKAALQDSNDAVTTEDNL